jgi:hypothetical protein
MTLKGTRSASNTDGGKEKRQAGRERDKERKRERGREGGPHHLNKATRMTLKGKKKKSVARKGK